MWFWFVSEIEISGVRAAALALCILFLVASEISNPDPSLIERLLSVLIIAGLLFEEFFLFASPRKLAASAEERIGMSGLA